MRRQEDCVFCAKVAFSHHPVERFTPLNPVVPGHQLFVPTSHLEDAGTDPIETGRVMAVASQWASDFYESYNLITSVGAPATQTIHHLHIHVIPRNVGDGLHLPWTGQVVQ